MNEEDHGATAALKKYAPGFVWLPRFLRDKLTPALVGSAITSLMIGLAYVFNSPQKDIKRVQDSITHFEQQLDQALKELHENGEQQAAMKNQLTFMSDEMKSQRAWREGIEREAEAPPHARRRMHWSPQASASWSFGALLRSRWKRRRQAECLTSRSTPMRRAASSNAR